jgi:hypothetical protein
MQDLPEKSLLLDALARFLDDQVRPAIEDPYLSFRLKIAINLAQLVAREIRAEDEHDGRQIQRLAALLGESLMHHFTSRTSREEWIIARQKRLVEELRVGAVTDEALDRIRAVLMANLEDKVSVANPRFDTSPIIE